MGAKSKKPTTAEAVRERMRETAAASGLTQQQIGEAMGFSPSGARQAVSRILKADTDYDPRLSTLVAFADAVKCTLSDIL
jgi:transcriptional regulator with XRE-family HTH domain